MVSSRRDGDRESGVDVGTAAITAHTGAGSTSGLALLSVPEPVNRSLASESGLLGCDWFGGNTGVAPVAAVANLSWDGAITNGSKGKGAFGMRMTAG